MLPAPPLSPEAHAAYQSLLDCKVLRTRFIHFGMFELCKAGLADFRVVPNDEDHALDWRLV